MSNNNNNQGNHDWFNYDPNLPAAVIFLVLFTATTALHGYQMLRQRAWLMIPFFIGGLFEVVGYLTRTILATQTPNWTKGPYITTLVLVLVAPALFAASIYMLLGRIIMLTDGEKHSLVRRTWLTKVFVAGDVLSFLMQAAGGGIMAGDSASSVSTGQNIIVGGLAVQIVFFAFFILTAALFNWRLNKGPTARSSEVPWKRHLYTLYAVSLLVFIRSIFRVVEYDQGRDGYLLSHEIFMYIFDSVLMLGVMVIFNIIHPSQISALLRQRKVTGDSSELDSVMNEPERVERSKA